MDEPGNDLTAFVLAGLVALAALIGYFYHEDYSNAAGRTEDARAVQLTISRAGP